jgi:hypothetical protein
MARVTVTAEETVHVARTPEQVFDYTQDYATRSVWDASVLEATVTGEDPRRVNLKVDGIGDMVLEYKLFRRGDRTSAAFTEVKSPYFVGGGGSWAYAARDGGTDWTQTNTLEFKSSLFGRLLAPIVRRRLSKGMRAAMLKAKGIMESAPAA